VSQGLGHIGVRAARHVGVEQRGGSTAHHVGGPAFAFASVKRLVYQATGVSFNEQLEAERDAFVAAAAGTKDFREGVAAFFERRAARFGG
jgi:enoyl-CoA hydratase/carnithine racemase